MYSDNNGFLAQKCTDCAMTDNVRAALWPTLHELGDHWSELIDLWGHPGLSSVRKRWCGTDLEVATCRDKSSALYDACKKGGSLSRC